MNRRQYLGLVGASALPLVGMHEQGDDSFDKSDFDELLPVTLEGRQQGRIIEHGVDYDAYSAVYESPQDGAMIQYIDTDSPQIIASMHSAHYTAGSVRDAVARLGTFFYRIQEVEYEFEDEAMLCRYRFRDGDTIEVEHLTENFVVQVNGGTIIFDSPTTRNDYLNYYINGKLED